MHKQLLKFRFEGMVFDNFDKMLIQHFSYSTDAKSAKQAMSNINFTAKKRCRLEVDTHLKLYGTLYCESILQFIVENNIVKWPQDDTIEDVYTYTYELSTGARKLNNNATLPYYADLFAFFGKDDFSQEQFLWKLDQLKSSRPILQKVSKDNGNTQVPLSDFSSEDNDTLKDDETIWVWDEEEGVYWKDGIKFGEYLISLEG